MASLFVHTTNARPNTAAELARALGGRQTGSTWMARCPAHDDSTPSLSICDGVGGKPLVFCFAGCTWERVITALRHRGLWPTGHQRDRKTFHRHAHRPD